MNRVVAILVLIATSAVVFVTPVAFKIKQARVHRAVRSQIRKGLSKDQLHVFIAAESDPRVEWKEENKEFSYQGEMYDVVTIEVKDGKRVYYCLNDKEEKKLNEAIAKVVNNHKGGKDRSILKTLLQIMQHGFPPVEITITSHFLPPVDKTYPSIPSRFYLQFIQCVNEPPPK